MKTTNLNRYYHSFNNDNNGKIRTVMRIENKILVAKNP